MVGPSRTSGRRAPRPVHDTSAIVFALADDGLARDAVSTIRGPAGPAGGGGALLAILRYVDDHPGARLHSLVADAPDRVDGARWSLVIPRPASPRRRVEGLHYLQLADSGDGPALLAALRAEVRGVEFAAHPVIQYPIVAPARAAGAPLSEVQWYRRVCSFDQARGRYDAPDAPPPIAVIDKGGITHEALVQRVVPRTVPSRSAPSRAGHNTSVCGVIAAAATITDDGPYVGCCDAMLHVHNVYGVECFDSQAYYAALRDVAASRPSVLNLSIGGEARDEGAERLIDECVRQGVVVVAAAGDDATREYPTPFPGGYPAVVAVGGTTKGGRATKSTTRGAHVAVAAPAERIVSLRDVDDFMEASGTSYAAAIVSAAIWMARCANTTLTPQRIKDDLIPRGVAKPGRPRDPAIGFGRLDADALVQAALAMR